MATGYTTQVDLGGRLLTMETGRIAKQADGAVMVRYGDSVVLATVTASKSAVEGQDFFPLTVDYRERAYAGGRIPGGFFKREGRPVEKEILTSRLIDRPLRPLFPKGFRNEIQLIALAIASDHENDPDILAMNGASAAVLVAGLPYLGPFGAVRIGLVEGRLVVNPTRAQRDLATLDLVVAATEASVAMVEAGALEVPEETMVEAITLGHAECKGLIRAQRELAERAGKPRWHFDPSVHQDPEIESRVRQAATARVREVIAIPEKVRRGQALGQIAEEVLAAVDPDGLKRSRVKEYLDKVERDEVRRMILDRGVRIDGRQSWETRAITAEVSFLPRTHGSALFTRGETQALTVATLGPSSDVQRIDTISPEESKRYLHHYNFPPYSTGENKIMRGPSRRDIGHGALAERALVPVLPDQEEFPYVIRLVSEVVTSNGSTSMASTCGSTLALMDAGVPIKAPVAGAAMGLVTEGEGRFAVLTDILGKEDAFGDMDFKVTGTREGITALQMDIKVRGINEEIIRTGLEKARLARLFILDRMLEVIPTARGDVSDFAPRIITIKINPEKIRDIIGKGGATIRKIQEETGTEINVEDDGTVEIAAVNSDNSRKAINWIESLTREVEVGGLYLGKVTRIMGFGAFVEILPGKEGLVRIGELADYHVPTVEDVVSIGDEIMVVVTEIDRQGRVNLSRKAAMQRHLAKTPA
jgi:polyribonucleotide nucleotidyltransferase